MKTIIMSTFLLSIGLLVSTKSFAQESTAEDAVKTVLLEMFKLSEDKNDKDLASHIQYRGTDVARKRKDVCNPDNEDELAQVTKVRTRINEFLKESYEFASFMQKEHPSNPSKSWYVWEVKFESKKIVFAFQKLNGKYVLGDID